MRYIKVLMSCLLVLSCSNSSVTPVKVEFDGLQSQELEAGKRASALMQARYPVIPHAPTINYILSIKNRLLLSGGYSQIPGDLYVVEDAKVFAYTLPNGDMYFSTGMLALAQDEAELAAVVSHEIAHVLLQHAKQTRIKKQQYIDNMKKLDAESNSSQLDLVVTMMAVASFGYSREMERESDKLMLWLLDNSGYDVCGAHRIFGRFELLEKEHSVEDASTTKLFDTHPNTAERLIEIQRRYPQEACQPTLTNKAQYQSNMKRLLTEP